MNELLRFKFDQHFLIHDFETEGTNLRYSRPWQLSWVETVGKKTVEKYNFLLKWDDLNISEGAAKITGFDRAKYLKDAVDPYFVLQLFESRVNNPNMILVGQNIINFDIYILNVLRQELGYPVDYSFIERCLDTRPLFFAITLNMQKPENESLLEWQYKLINMPEIRQRRGITSLPAMLKYFDIPYDENKLHDALYDIEMTKECLFHILNRLDI